MTDANLVLIDPERLHAAREMCYYWIRNRSSRECVRICLGYAYFYASKTVVSV